MIKLDNLSFAYRKKRILKKISFTVNKGEFTCLLGANGSGKTTILKCLNGILKAEFGDVYIDKRNLKQLTYKEVARYISMVSQEHRVIFSYKTIDVVIMGINPYLNPGSQPREEVYKRAEGILDMFNILDLAERTYNSLSGGERQLVLIARALMQNTPYLIMDEPTSHLDFKNQHLLMQEIKKLTKKGAGVITALHDPNLAMKFCDNIIIVKQGKVIAWGKTEEILNDHNLQRAYEIDIKIKNSIKGVEIVSSPTPCGYTTNFQDKSII